MWICQTFHSGVEILRGQILHPLTMLLFLKIALELNHSSKSISVIQTATDSKQWWTTVVMPYLQQRGTTYPWKGQQLGILTGLSSLILADSRQSLSSYVQYVHLKLKWATSGQHVWHIFAIINASAEEYNQKHVSRKGSSLCCSKGNTRLSSFKFLLLGL